MLPKGGSQRRSRQPPDDHVVRHPRPPRSEAVDHLRAGPADGPCTRAVLAPRREQAVRRAQEARRPRVRDGSKEPAGRRPRTVYRSPARAGGRWPNGCHSRAQDRARVRGPREGFLRRARDEAGRPRRAGPAAGVERPVHRVSAGSRGTTSRAKGRSRSGCRVGLRASSWSGSTSSSSDGRSGPRPPWSSGPTTSAMPSPIWASSWPKPSGTRHGGVVAVMVVAVEEAVKGEGSAASDSRAGRRPIRRRGCG